MDHGNHELRASLIINIHLIASHISCMCFKEKKTKEYNKSNFQCRLIACFHHLEKLQYCAGA
jgi:hypothetical protein